jgi:hypothetical protein
MVVSFLLLLILLLLLLAPDRLGEEPLPYRTAGEESKSKSRSKSKTRYARKA